MPSTSACQDASMMFGATPTVSHDVVAVARSRSAPG